MVQMVKTAKNARFSPELRRTKAAEHARNTLPFIGRKAPAATGDLVAIEA